MKKLLLLLLLSPSLLFSQAKQVTLSGKVVLHSNGTPIEFASVMARSISDSTLKFVTASDSVGDFSFEKLFPGTWQIKCSFIGFNIKDTTVTITADQKKTNIGNIRLSQTATSLKEVMVTAEQQKALEYSIDKKIYNVGQDIQAETGSASDVLKNIPSVDVDIDGNVSLRGSGNLLILIDGKPSPMMAKSAAEALQNLPANSIERIEVITNPSAKYKPDGTGGIINIVMKKNTKMGMNGSITVNAGNNDRYNGNLTLSYKPGKLNVYGSFGLRQNTHLRFGADERMYLDSLGAIQSHYFENDTANGKSFSQTAIFGMDYEIDSNNSISLSGNYRHFTVDRDNLSRRKLFDKDNIVLTEDYERFNNFLNNETELEATFSFEHRFKKEEHLISLECVGVIQDEHEKNYNVYEYFFPAALSSHDNIFLDKKDNPVEIALDYTNPISEDAVLEAGYAGTFNNIYVDNELQYFDSTNGFVKNDSTSYIFEYVDAVHAVYATWEQSIEDFGFVAGIRAEQAGLKGNVVTIDSVFQNDYISLYPTLHLSYEFDKMQLGLSYSRRVNRPDGDELNPFPEYEDPRNLQAGNPNLLPEYIHAAELGAEIKGKKVSFIPTLYYRYTYNGFTEVTAFLNDSTLLTTQENLSSSQDAGLEMILTGKIGRWLSGNLSGNVFYKQIDASNLGYSANRSSFSFSNNLNTNIRAGQNTMLQLSCNYRSEELTPQGRKLPSFTVNIGAKQELFRNKLALVLTFNDVFKTQKYGSELSSEEMIRHTTRIRNSRILFVGLKYRFGTLTKKQKEEALQFDNSEK